MQHGNSKRHEIREKQQSETCGKVDSVNHLFEADSSEELDAASCCTEPAYGCIGSAIMLHGASLVAAMRVGPSVDYPFMDLSG